MADGGSAPPAHQRTSCSRTSHGPHPAPDPRHRTPHSGKERASGTFSPSSTPPSSVTWTSRTPGPRSLPDVSCSAAVRTSPIPRRGDGLPRDRETLRPPTNSPRSTAPLFDKVLSLDREQGPRRRGRHARQRVHCGVRTGLLRTLASQPRPRLARCAPGPPPRRPTTSPEADALGPALERHRTRPTTRPSTPPRARRPRKRTPPTRATAACSPWPARPSPGAHRPQLALSPRGQGPPRGRATTPSSSAASSTPPSTSRTTSAPARPQRPDCRRHRHPLRRPSARPASRTSSPRRRPSSPSSPPTASRGREPPGGRFKRWSTTPRLEPHPPGSARRVDRFGQRRDVVRAVTLYGTDNYIDGIVLDVLIKKHREITRTTGVRARPDQSTASSRPSSRALLLRGQDPEQLTFDLASPPSATNSTAPGSPRREGERPPHPLRQRTSSRRRWPGRSPHPGRARHARDVAAFTEEVLRALGASVTPTAEGFQAVTSTLTVGCEGRPPRPPRRAVAVPPRVARRAPPALLARTDPVSRPCPATCSTRPSMPPSMPRLARPAAPVWSGPPPSGSDHAAAGAVPLPPHDSRPPTASAPSSPRMPGCWRSRGRPPTRRGWTTRRRHLTP